MICKHDFFKTGEVSRMREPNGLKFIVGVEVVCVQCGQIRRAYADGLVEIKIQGNKPIDEDHGSPS